MDVEQYRRASLEQWSRSAAGWEARRPEFDRMAMPVSAWMVEATRPQPGHRVLELAAGMGETGFLAAELIEPGGRLTCSDFAEPMLEAARRRAAELGLRSVEFRALNAESLDLDTASYDGVLCRFAYMLMADPEAALAEARRVLRPGGRIALAAWDAAERNPWAWRAQAAARRVAGAPEPPADAPGMFTFAQEGRIEALLSGAGFTELDIDAIALELAYDGFGHWWDATTDLSSPFADLLRSLEQARRAELRADLESDLSEYVRADGRLLMPARALVAAATA